MKVLKATIFTAIYILTILPIINGQNLQNLDVSINFNDRDLAFPQSGTLIAPQFSSIHLNEDGKEDLFIFDRGGDNVLCFINQSENGVSRYSYAPEYISSFPEGLHSWALSRDFDQDGISDIMCAPINAPVAGIEVWKGHRDNMGKLSYELFQFDVGDYDVLNFKTNNIYTPIYGAVTDIPGIIDVDGDDDLDVFTFDPGGGLLQLYLNQSVEQGYGLDTFIMQVSDRCWGKFLEDDFSEFIYLSDDPGTCANRLTGPGSTRHSGSTILPFDQDKNGTIDIILGDLASSGLVFLQNGGNNENGWIIDQDAQFPSYDVPVNMNIFLSSFLVDVNGDGREDFIATQNTRASGNNDDHVWLYYGQEDDTHTFAFQQSDFLIDDMLSIGGFSYPAVGDVDADGDLDLIIGVNGILTDEGFFDSRIHLFENITEGNQLAFKHIDDDFLGMNVNASSSGRFAPAIGDLDGDGDDDIIVGNRLGRLTFYENVAGPGAPYSFGDPESNYSGVNLRQNSMPQIIDLDEDGLSDLIVGERNDNKVGEVFGGLNYYVNQGSIGEAIFNGDSEAEGNTPVLGGVFTRDPGFTVGASSPGFVNTGSDFIGWVGSESGKLRRYSNIAGNLDGTFEGGEVDELPYPIGRNITVIPGDLNGDDIIDLVIGSSRGGVSFFSSGYKIDGSVSIEEKDETDEMLIYPNPANGLIRIQSSANSFTAEIYDMNGKRLFKTSQKEIELPEPGVYIVRIISDGVVNTQRIINF